MSEQIKIFTGEELSKLNIIFLKTIYIQKEYIKQKNLYQPIIYFLSFQEILIPLCGNLYYLYILKKMKHSDSYCKKKHLKKSFICCIISYKELHASIPLIEVINRYFEGGNNMKEHNTSIDIIKEEETNYSDDDLYNISSWGADLSFREIVSMYKEGDLLKPELQRKYVWTKNEASRFIDSILLGLPVPSVFFAKEKDETNLIVDGYQRIMTVHDFMNGIFSGDGKIFKLSNTGIINERWRGKSFNELTLEEQRRIKNKTIHAIIFEQKYPNNNTGMYQIFERINTSGRILKPQEIRNCVYQGNFNKLLFELNKNKNWREIINLQEDVRMADLELILRFFAIRDLDEIVGDVKQINLVKHLNLYMGKYKDLDNEKYNQMKTDFEKVVKLLNKELGKNAFRNLKKDQKNFTKKVSPSIFDAVTIATYLALQQNIEPLNLQQNYIELLQNNEFINATTIRTTNIENIKQRISKAAEILYGINYE